MQMWLQIFWVWQLSVNKNTTPRCMRVNDHAWKAVNTKPFFTLFDGFNFHLDHYPSSRVCYSFSLHFSEKSLRFLDVINYSSMKFFLMPTQLYSLSKGNQFSEILLKWKLAQCTACLVTLHCCQYFKLYEQAIGNKEMSKNFQKPYFCLTRKPLSRYFPLVFVTHWWAPVFVICAKVFIIAFETITSLLQSDLTAILSWKFIKTMRLISLW